MYTESFSSSFAGMTFAQASELCFVKLKLLLLAIEVGSEGKGLNLNVLENFLTFLFLSFENQMDRLQLS